MKSQQETKSEWQTPQLFKLNDVRVTLAGSQPASYELHCTDTANVYYSQLAYPYFPTTSGSIRNDPVCGVD